MKEILQRLGIKEVNQGVCTGTKWIDTKGTERKQCTRRGFQHDHC